MSSPRYPSRRLPRQTFASALALACVCAAPAQFRQSQSTSTDPYLLPVATGWSTISLLTVADATSVAATGGYKMVGMPDGLGAFLSGGNITALMNHELASGQGAVRAHGSAGAFVSRWSIDPTSLAVTGGSDLVGSNSFGAQSVATWNTSSGAYNALGTTAFNRFCSADLAPVSALSNAGLGTTERLFFNGEEAGSEGRAFAHIATGPNAGTSYQLPRLGRLSFENVLANPNSGNKTVVIGTDDSSTGQIYVYVGDKQASGNEVERAGLTNGTLYGVAVAGAATESRTNGLDGVAGNDDHVAFTLHNHGDVSNTTGASLQTSSAANGVTAFLRPEDGVWSADGSAFYFATTDRFDGPEGTASQRGASRLYRLTFSDTNDFTAGGSIDLLIEGTGAANGQMFDNVTLSADGTKLLLQEDPGGSLSDDGSAGSGASYLANIWSYDIATDSLTKVAQTNPEFFQSGGASFMTEDEESSGIIDISGLVDGGDGYSYYLLTVQSHASTADASLAQYGQLVVLTNDPAASSRLGVIPEPTQVASCLGAIALAATALRRRSRQTPAPRSAAVG